MHESKLADELDSFRLIFLVWFIMSLITDVVIFIVCCIKGIDLSIGPFLPVLICGAGWLISKELRNAAEKDYKQIKGEEMVDKKQIPFYKHFYEERGAIKCKTTERAIRYPLISFDDMTYCPFCGQKLTTSDKIDWNYSKAIEQDIENVEEIHENRT